MPWGWIVGGVLAMGALGALVWLAWSRGGEGARADQAEGQRDAADARAERMAGPMPNRVERARAVRRRLRARGMSDAEIDAALRRAADGGDAGDPPRSA